MQVRCGLLAELEAGPGLCRGVFPTEAIITNTAGNGSGDAFFLPSGVPSVPRNATHGFIYTVSDSSGVQYSSGCVVVTLD